MRNLWSGRETDLSLNNISLTDSGSSEQGIRDVWRGLERLEEASGEEMGLELAGRGQEGSGCRQNVHRFTVGPWLAIEADVLKM